MKLQLAVLFCMLGLAMAYQNDGDMGRVLGGSDISEKGKVPWMVAIHVLNEDMDKVDVYCGGVIVSNMTVITAATCLAGLPRVGMAPHRVRLFFGFTMPSTAVEDDYMYITNYTIYPDFIIHANHYDIAILTLAIPQPETDYVRYVFMPTAAHAAAKEPYAGMMGSIYGWGVHDKTGLVPKEPLSYVDMRVLTTDNCTARMKEIYYTVQNSSLCTDTAKATVGFCKFDAGGPLIVMIPGSSIKPTLVGIASYFDACGTRYPNVFTKVADPAVLKWVTANGGPK